MEFLKKNWSLLILVSLIALYLGIGMGTSSCPMCLVLGSDDKGSQSRFVAVDNSEITNISEWTATQLDGSPVSFASEKGKVSVLVYWATWCSPCVEEISDLIALRNHFSRENVSIIGISVDSEKKDLKPFVEASGINYAIARQTPTLEKAFGPVRYIPTMFIIDKEGRVRHQHTGIVGKNVIQGQIEALLGSDAHALAATL